jgi:hypothetical protein
MSNPQKLLWLRRVLLAKVILTLGLWGLPALLAPRALLSLFGIEMPADPIFVRLFGAVVTAFGVAYWFAYRDPVRNVAIVKAGVVDNGLVTLVIVAVALTSGPPGWFFLVSAMLTAFFLVAFLVLMPQEAPATERAHQGVLSQ